MKTTLLHKLIKNQRRNSFMKKETLFFGAIFVCLLLVLFAHNGWSNLISLIFCCLAIIVSTSFLYILFQGRERSYETLITTLQRDEESIIFMEEINNPKISDQNIRSRSSLKGISRNPQLKNFNYQFNKSNKSFLYKKKSYPTISWSNESNKYKGSNIGFITGTEVQQSELRNYLKYLLNQANINAIQYQELKLHLIIYQKYLSKINTRDTKLFNQVKSLTRNMETEEK